jgi:hypothetical protein
MRPEVHDRYPVSDIPGQPEVMGHDEHRQAKFGPQPQQQGQDLAANRCIQARDRLVGNQHPRIEDQGSGDHHALTLAPAESSWGYRRKKRSGGRSPARARASATNSSSLPGIR